MADRYSDIYIGKMFEILESSLSDGTSGIKTMDYAHHEIHSGSHFMYSDSVEIDSAGTQDYLITTPDTAEWAHMFILADGSAITQMQLFEGSTKTGTTLQTVFNSNRNSSKTSGLTVHKGTSGSGDGTLIHQYKGGSASAQSRDGGQARNEEEIILKQNTKYILRVTSGTNDNLVNVKLEWYEHIFSNVITE